MTPLGPQTHPRPECIALGVRDGAAPSPRPPVRIFLGTEPAQHRAERVFVWSIEQVRDPSRVYEIHRMSRLGGFRTRGWTTGFSNYRYAIPHFAGGRGRAVYNDVDQIYLADPALLFDADMGEHGVLAIRPDDPSVMLIDCERAADVWPLVDAQRRSKAELQRRAAEIPGLLGRLDPAWNARDGEYAAGRSRLLHYTTLHTQPWRPFPERFVYQENEHAGLWHALERSADEAAFQVFTRARPSARFGEMLARLRRAGRLSREGGAGLFDAGRDEALRDLVRRARPTSLSIWALGQRARWRGLLDAEPGREDSLEKRWGVGRVVVHDPVVDPGPPERADAAVARGALEPVPDEDLPWVLDEFFRSGRRMVHASVSLASRPGAPDRAAEWWTSRFEAASARRPQVRWQLVLTHPNGRLERREGGRWLGDEPPSVWALADDRPGNTTQSKGLADALGWPYETRTLAPGPLSALHNRLLGASRAGIDARRSSPLGPPWPDLVIAAGRRTAPVAQWIREQSGGRTRLVQLGRKGGDAAERFDLVVTPAYARLFPHPRRIVTRAPLCQTRPERLAAAAAAWRERLSGARSPRVAVLVGGTSGQYRIDPDTARRLGEDVMAMARETGGSILATTSRRLSPEATDAFCAAVEGAAYVHRWRPDDADNPYPAFLALADAFVITGDSESMIAEAIALGRPVYVYPLPERRSFRWLHVPREWVLARALGRPANRRGTVRPQHGLEWLCARLVDRGFVRPSRDLGRLHEDLFASGLARPFGVDYAGATRAHAPDLERVVERVRALMGVGGD